MIHFRRAVFLMVLLAAAAQRAQQSETPKRYFYTKKPYGSEALFNPVSFFFNGGYDVSQLQSVPNTIGGHNYHEKFSTVFRNLGDPFPRIRQYGWGKFVRTELLPLSFTKETMQWIPNYQQHLFASGMQYTMLREWFEEHGFGAPRTLAATTLMAQHLFNEAVETGENEGYSVDEISDIYIFDLGGIVLFSFDSVNEFFSRTLNLSDWSLQSTITFPNGRVNAGQYFAVKWKFPFSQDYSLFYRYGMGALFGLSKKVSAEDSFSGGVGFKSKHLVNLAGTVRWRTIETSWHAGVFYDRNNSLLWSVVLSGVKEYFIMADIYPGILQLGHFSPGIWTIVGRDGTLMAGFTTRFLLSAGYEARGK